MFLFLVLINFLQLKTFAASPKNCSGALYPKAPITVHVSFDYSQSYSFVEQALAVNQKQLRTPYQIDWILSDNPLFLDYFTDETSRRQIKDKIFFWPVKDLIKQVQENSFSISEWEQEFIAAKSDMNARVAFIATPSELSQFLKLYAREYHDLFVPLPSFLARTAGNLISVQRDLNAAEGPIKWFDIISQNPHFAGSILQVIQTSDILKEIEPKAAATPKPIRPKRTPPPLSQSDNSLETQGVSKRMQTLQAAVKRFEDWVLVTDADELRLQLLGRKGQFKDWFSTFRKNRDGKKNPGWWTFFSDQALMKMHRTQKIELPKDVLERLGLAPLPYLPWNSIELVKLRQFEQAAIQMPKNQLRVEILSQKGPFKEWFTNFRVKHTGNDGKLGWWTYFSDEFLRKAYETRKIYLPALVLKRLGLQELEVTTGPGKRIDTARVEAFEDYIRTTPLEILIQEMRSGKNPHKAWFDSFRRSHDGQIDSKGKIRNGWWRYLTDETLNKLNQVRSYDLPPSVIRRVTLAKPLPEGKSESPPN